MPTHGLQDFTPDPVIADFNRALENAGEAIHAALDMGPEGDARAARLVRASVETGRLFGRLRQDFAARVALCPKSAVACAPLAQRAVIDRAAQTVRELALTAPADSVWWMLATALEQGWLTGATSIIETARIRLGEQRKGFFQALPAALRSPQALEVLATAPHPFQPLTQSTIFFQDYRQAAEAAVSIILSPHRTALRRIVADHMPGMLQDLRRPLAPARTPDERRYFVNTMRSPPTRLVTARPDADAIEFMFEHMTMSEKTFAGLAVALMGPHPDPQPWVTACTRNPRIADVFSRQAACVGFANALAKTLAKREIGEARAWLDAMAPLVVRAPAPRTKPSPSLPPGEAYLRSYWSSAIIHARLHAIPARQRQRCRA